MDRIIIASKQYDEINILKEKEEYIRLEAVDLCFALNVLVNDSSALVRAAVARKKLVMMFWWVTIVGVCEQR